MEEKIVNQEDTRVVKSGLGKIRVSDLTYEQQIEKEINEEKRQ